MLNLEETISDSVITDIDARIKIYFVLQITILLVLASTLLEILAIALFPIVVLLNLFGIRHLVSLIWSMKWYFVLFFVFGTLLSRSLNLEDLILISVTFLILFITFQVFSKTTNPDEVTDSLIKLKIPPNVAWRIGVTLRQVYFIYDEIDQINQIQAKFKGYDKVSKFAKIKNIAEIITAIYANSIRRATYFSNTLQNRGFTRAHSHIITMSSSMRVADLGYFFISSVPLFLFILTRSQLFI